MQAAPLGALLLVIASVSEAIHRVGQPNLPSVHERLLATLAPLARNDTWNLVMLSVAKHLFRF